MLLIFWNKGEMNLIFCVEFRKCNIHGRGQKFHSSARNYEWNLEKTSNSSQSPRPTGPVLLEELLEEVI